MSLCAYSTVSVLLIFILVVVPIGIVSSYKMFVVRYAAQWTFGRLTPLRFRFEADYERVMFL